MKKIFIGGPGACGVHYEKYIMETLLTKNEDYKITKEIKDADIIVILNTCAATYLNFSNNFKYIEKVLLQKKENAEVIVSGCLTKGVKFELTDRQKEILNQVISIKSDKILEYIVRMGRFEIDTDLLEDFNLPYWWKQNGIAFSITEGCLNNCSFCKTNFMNFDLKSTPYENLEKLISDINEIDYPFNHMHIHSSNLSLYGVDLYGKQRCHEAISMLTSPECVKFVSLGALINWYPELVKEILVNPKIKNIFISLETGSERIYKLMNRPISLEKLIQIIKLIRKERPDIIINTEFIAGFPTETIDDLKKSAELAYELDVMPLFINPFMNSKQIPASNLPQHSFAYCKESTAYLIHTLYPLHNKFEDAIKNGEMFVVGKYDKYNAYRVLLTDGRVIRVGFDRFDREYNTGDLIAANTIKPKQFVKRR